jgi:hypothetical protein
MKIRKLMWKYARAKGRTDDFLTVHLVAAEHQPPYEVHLGDKLRDDYPEDLRKMLFDDFPELLQLVDSPDFSRPWDHPIDTTCPMRHQKLKCISHGQMKELNRQLKDVVDPEFTPPSRSEFGSPIVFVWKAESSLRMWIDYRGLHEVTRKDAYPLPRVNDTLDDLNSIISHTHLNLAFARFWQVRVKEEDAHKTEF